MSEGKKPNTDASGWRQTLNLPVYHEPVADNAYLADFYRDTKRYSFATQIYLLNRRFQQHREVAAGSDGNDDLAHRHAEYFLGQFRQRQALGGVARTALGGLF